MGANQSGGYPGSSSSDGVDDFSAAALKAGDEASWELAIQRLWDPLQTFIRVQGAVDVDATLGEIFLDLARNIDGFDGDWQSFKAWTFTIARRRVIDDFRYFQRRPMGLTDPQHLPEVVRIGDDVELEALDRLGQDWLIEVLSLLTPIQREIVILRFVLDFSVREVGIVTGATETAIKANQRRAVHKLRRALLRDERYRPSVSPADVPQ